MSPIASVEELQRISDGGRIRSSRYDWRSKVFTAETLQTMTFPPISYVVPDLIPEGLSILAGRPKVGKSWMALDIAIAVAAGRICLGDKKPLQGDVLYCAMEDNPRRLQRRIDKLMGVFGDIWPERLTLTNSWRRLDQGGVDDIADWASGVSEPRVAILDTLAGVKPIKTNTGYDVDYASLEALHRLANQCALAIPVLHHTRKMDADDPLDTVSGTLGLAGCADTVLVIARSSQGTTLYVRGRDVEEAEHAVNFDKHSCRWTIMGEAAAVHRSSERQAILAALEGGEMAVAEIVAATDKPRNNVEKLLHFMVKDGEVVRIKRGVYALERTPGKNGKPVRSDPETAEDSHFA